MFELGTFIVSIIAFLILFWVIQRVGFKPLNNILEKRRQYVITQLTEAEESRAQAEKHLAEQRQLLDEARRQAKDLLDAARQRADEQARELLGQAQAEAQRLLESSRELIERERVEAMNAVLSAVSGLTVQISEKLLRHHVTEVEHQAMIEEAGKQLGELVC